MKRLFISLIILVVALLLGCGKDSDQEATDDRQQTDVSLDFSADTKMYKLAIIDGQNAEPYLPARLKLLEILKQRGLVEGKNLKIFSWNVENNNVKSEKALSEAIAQEPDVIVVNGTVPTIVAKKLYFNDGKNKFVFICVTDPVGIGAIDDFAVPIRFNFTGVSYPVIVKSRFKFITDLMPNVQKIGLIYSEMPQSLSYRKWVETLFKDDPEFANVKVEFRSVPFITGEDGVKKMADLAVKHVQDLNSIVDVFVSPNDQMGVNKYFPEVVWKNAKKPLIGLGINDVMKGWGATAVIYPSHDSMGEQAGIMVMKMFKGVKMRFIPAEWPKKNGFAFDLNKTKKFGIEVPVKFMQLAGNNIVR